MRKTLLLIPLVLGLLHSPGCVSARSHAEDVQDSGTDRVTVGTVQKEIRVGMSGAEVIEAMGSPNIVTTDEKRREVWTYDKFATDTVYSSSSGGITALIFGWWSDGGAGGGTRGSYSSGAASRSQRTLTVIIKFDENGLVRDFAYHATRF